jgi:hypothetical protein
MRIKDLKEYIKNFKDDDTVAISTWDNAGAHYYTPNIPCCDPIKFKTAGKENIAVIGHFDVCLANMVIRPK